MPSLYEGFGLPALEAMACGVPVAASSASSLPEIIQDAGIFFNPLSVTDMSEAIYKVLTDEHLRLDLVKRGFKRMKQFSWDKAADETLRLYGELL
jgi:glycosyltransferase involved in cell wall biosynthesis